MRLACVSNVLRKDVQVNSMVIADVCVRVDSRLVIVVDDQYSQLLIQFRNWYVGKAATTGITVPIVPCNYPLLRKTPFFLSVNHLADPSKCEDSIKEIRIGRQ